MTKKLLMTSIIAATLILSMSSFAQQNAQGQTTQIIVSDQTSCESLGGIWESSFSVCTLNFDLTIDVDEELIVDKISLVSNNMITNNGKIVVVGSTNIFVPGELTNNGSLITNNGIIDLNGDAASNSGRLRNQAGGDIENNGIINANGGVGISSASIAMVSSGSSIENNGTINLNAGSGIQSGKLSIDPGTILTNNNTINNNSLIQNFGTIFNGCDSEIIGSGTIENNGIITDDTNCNASPDCSNANASTTILYQDDTIWPPNHKMESVFIQGVIDPDNDPVMITIDSIFQDEPTNGLGDGDQSPDGSGIGTDTAQVRAERSGEDNGRVYHINFTADDGNNGMCIGEVFVAVPHDKKSTAIDDGPVYNSINP